MSRFCTYCGTEADGAVEDMPTDVPRCARCGCQDWASFQPDRPTMLDKVNFEYARAAIHVAAHARAFARTTDESPLRFGTFEQGTAWDGLCTSIAVLDELEETE